MFQRCEENGSLVLLAVLVIGFVVYLFSQQLDCVSVGREAAGLKKRKLPPPQHSPNSLVSRAGELVRVGGYIISAGRIRGHPRGRVFSAWGHGKIELNGG